MSNLYYNGEMKNSENELSELEEKIYRLLDAYPYEYLDEMIPADDDGSLFDHLSRMRGSLLNWYPFGKGKTILEIESEYGALTGTLCDNARKVIAVESSAVRAQILNKRYADRDNLYVFVAKEFEEVSGIKEKFDYIVLVGIAERWGKKLADRLNFLTSFLQPEGKILLTMQNRMGIRYLCGAVDEYVHRPFEGIAGFPNGCDDTLLSRKELIDCLEKAGLFRYKFFYPLPDHKLTQAVYSDEYLPTESIRDRIIPYYRGKEKLVATEDRLYEDIIQNGVLPVFANSFLVECSVASEVTPVIFAALSTDREKPHAFSTVIQDNGKVIKRPLFAEGKKTLEALYTNSVDLKRHGIETVPIEMHSDRMEMPFIGKENLADQLKIWIHKDKRLFERVIEELYQKVLSSSEHVSVEKCALNLKDIEDTEIGPVLKWAYIDLIPYNCFYKDGEFLFYDQEFKRECFPAKYILFRILRYMYFYIPDAETIIPLSYFKKKYSLEHIWELFEKEEARFVSKNREYQTLNVFYKWTQSAGETIWDGEREKKNGREIPGYLQNEKLRELKMAQLRIYKYFSSFCEKNDLRYCAIYGSLLGSVRHEGFIPWDDDIDLAMPREDFEKLKLLSSQIEPPFFFQFPENDPECFYGGYGKLRDSGTTALEWFNEGHNCNQGVWIDIFPLDNCSDDKHIRQKQLKKIHFIQQLLWYKVYPERKDIFRLEPTGKIRLVKIKAAIYTHRHLCRKLDRALTACRDESSKIAVLSRYRPIEQIEFFDRKDFLHAIYLKFEDTKIPVPIGYKNLLNHIAGEDYRVYPNLQERKPHHNVETDINRPYSEVIRARRVE